MRCTLASAAAVASQPHSARQFLKRNEICVSTVHQRLQRRQVRPEALQLEQVQAVHKFLQHQQHLGAIASAADVIEALPESLLRPVGELKALFDALRNGGFERQLLSQLLTTAPTPTLAEAVGSGSSADAGHGSGSSSQDSSLSSLGAGSGGGGVPGVLLVPPDEVATRLAHLSSLLDLAEDRLPQFVSTRPALLAAPAPQVAAAARWLRSVLGWSAMGLLKGAAQWPGLLCRTPEDLDAVACRVQHALDLTTAELVLVLHIAPQLLLLQHNSPELQNLLEACSCRAANSSHGAGSSSSSSSEASSGSSVPAAAGAAGAVSKGQAASPALALAKAAAPHPPAWDVWAAQAHQQRLAVLKLCSAHGASLQELGEVLKARPTILREVRV